MSMKHDMTTEVDACRIESASGEHAPRGRELAIVVPTFNERQNVEELVRRLSICLGGIDWEVVFVDDDSSDGTSDFVRALAGKYPNVRCLQRIGRRGLASACIEGMLATSAPHIAVMDGDLQHDESILPRMFECLKSGRYDIVVGSRYVDGGGIGAWSERRAMISRLATRVSQLVVPKELRDPMSGFFMITRDAFMECVRNLSALGFKILVDLFASSRRPMRFFEVPYQFRERYAGQSKLDSQVAWEYGMLLLDKTIGRFVPARFIAFAAVGGIGVGVHMAVLSLLYLTGLAAFATSQAMAAGVAMVFNFAVNNLLTYRDKRLKGWDFLRGLASFVLVCSVGALANVGIAQYLFEQHQGWVLAAVAGILVGAVWNYSVSSFYTWGKSTSRK